MSNWVTAPQVSGSAAGFGLYLHVPFCQHRCGYCDFATTDRHGHLHQIYAEQLIAQIGRWSQESPSDHAGSMGRAADAWPALTSIFVGGGTPSQLGVSDTHGIDAVVAKARNAFDCVSDIEVTVEVNPEDATPELFEALKAAGATRVSLGMQAGTQRLLTLLERQHDPEGPVRAAAMASASGLAASLDLIYGTPTETLEDLNAALDLVTAADVDHVSAYALSIHENTAFGQRLREGTLAPTNDDVQRARWEHVRTRLAEAGFGHYEISNWARSDATRSQHNILYWRHGDYLGVGVGAHAHMGGRRWWSTRSTDAWLDAAQEEGIVAPAGDDPVDADAYALERLMLGLRLVEGVPASDAPGVNEQAREGLVAGGMLHDGEDLRCTPDGWYLIDDIVGQLEPTGMVAEL